MKLLKEKILKSGEIINPTTLKVDSFLNHQIDATIMMEMGKEFKKRFKEKKSIKSLLSKPQVLPSDLQLQ